MAYKSALPDARAIGIFSRSILRELKRAHYSRQDVLLLVNALLEATGTEFGADAASWRGRVHDAETDLLADATLRDALAFVLRASREAGASVLLVVVSVEAEAHCSDESLLAAHEAIAARLHRDVRDGDVTGRLSSNDYVIALPGATTASARPILRRFLKPLVDEVSRDPRTRGVSFTTRAADAAEDDDVSVWVARTLAATPFAYGTDAPPASVVAPPRRAPEDGVTLALGGGAARAAAHVGVLDALASEGVPVRGIAGTGGGALVGAMYLTGMRPAAILDAFVSFAESSVYAQIRREYASFLRHARVADGTPRALRRFDVNAALYATDRAAALTERHFQGLFEFFVGEDRDLATLEAPFCATAVDLVSGRAVHLSHGSLYAALRAALALPGLFPPFTDGDRELVDGSAIVELPVAAAEKLSAAHQVLAVYLARPPLPRIDLVTSAEILARVNAIVHAELLREQLKRAHHHLTVHVEPFGWLEFRRARQAANLGAIAARQWLAPLSSRL